MTAERDLLTSAADASRLAAILDELVNEHAAGPLPAGAEPPVAKRELARAAAAYAVNASYDDKTKREREKHGQPPVVWPLRWPPTWWRPRSPARRPGAGRGVHHRRAHAARFEGMMARLSAPMLAALRDARNGPLTLRRHGFANNALLGHSTSTVEALSRRGLLAIKSERNPRRPGGWKKREATITEAGRKAATEAGGK